jgi:hypothetical protein
VSVYYEGGSISTKPLTPQQLFDAANEWSASVKSASQPYTALLLPWIIANGPQPPNAEDLEHQRETLMTCAKLRSQVQDRLNLLEYMMDPNHTAEFAMAPGDPDRIAKLHAAISGDYDLISECASFDMDNAKGALEPEPYARTQKNLPDYTLTLLPTDLPKRVAGPPPVVTPPPPPQESQLERERELQFHEAQQMGKLIHR